MEIRDPRETIEYPETPQWAKRLILGSFFVLALLFLRVYPDFIKLFEESDLYEMWASPRGDAYLWKYRFPGWFVFQIIYFVGWPFPAGMAAIQGGFFIWGILFAEKISTRVMVTASLLFVADFLFFFCIFMLFPTPFL